MEQTKEKKYIVGSIICGLLTAFGIVMTVITLVNEGSHGIWFLGDCGQLLLLILICWYAFIGYKKPHGNLLRYIILFHAAMGMISIPSLVSIGDTLMIILTTIEIGLRCYIAGRLNKIRECMVLMLLLSVIFVVEIIFSFMSGNVGLTPLIAWIDICVAYVFRYKDHREAGLMDASKK